jgi:hypothetical protein
MTNVHGLFDDALCRWGMYGVLKHELTIMSLDNDAIETTKNVYDDIKERRIMALLYTGGRSLSGWLYGLASSVWSATTQE